MSALPPALAGLWDAEDQRTRSIWPFTLADFDFWEAAVEGCDSVGAYWCEFQTVPEDGLLAAQPDPDRIVRTPWIAGRPETMATVKDQPRLDR
jgi:hypothetical protein